MQIEHYSKAWKLPEVQAEKPITVAGDGLSQKSSRGDKTAIELFLAGVRGWETVLQRRLDNAKPN